jgi:lysophospholipase L1-like esterase
MAGYRLVGRCDDADPAGPWIAWPGTALVARFEGSGAWLHVHGSSDYFGVVLDGEEVAVVAATPARERYPLVTGLDAGPHDLIVTKRTEALVSEAQILGLEPAPGGRLLDPPPPGERRLELVGDSVTAGFGVLGANETCPFSPATEDWGESYGALAARALDAEAHVIAWSGRGACRNYAGEPGAPMPALFERALPARAGSRWDFGRFVPHVVVVNLGTNDFSVGWPPDLPFGAAYLGLLQRIRAEYPMAPIVCALGPMLAGPELAAARTAVAAAAAAVRADGAPAVTLLEHPPQRAADGLGCDWHPSARTHARMATELVAVLRPLVGW